MENRKRIFVFVLIFLVLAFGSLSVYLYIQKGNLTKAHEKLNNEFTGLENSYKAAVGEIQNVSGATNADKLSTKYDSYTLLGKCGVGVAIPDETNRFDPFSAEGVIDGKNRAWRLHVETIAKTSDEDKSMMIGGIRNYVILRNDNEASGYVSGYLSIECKENKEGYTTETFTTKYLDTVKKDNKSAEAITGVKANTLDVKKLETVKISGVDVNKVIVERNGIAESSTENGYMFVYGNKYYYIYSIAMTSEKKALRSLTSMIDSIYLYK